MFTDCEVEATLRPKVAACICGEWDLTPALGDNKYMSKLLEKRGGTANAERRVTGVVQLG